MYSICLIFMMEWTMVGDWTIIFVWKLCAHVHIFAKVHPPPRVYENNAKCTIEIRAVFSIGRLPGVRGWRGPTTKETALIEMTDRRKNRRLGNFFFHLMQLWFFTSRLSRSYYGRMGNHQGKIRELEFFFIYFSNLNKFAISFEKPAFFTLFYSVLYKIQ